MPVARYQSTLPVNTSGQVVNVQTDQHGIQYVIPCSAAGGGIPVPTNSFTGDSVALGNVGGSLLSTTMPLIFNGTSLDRMSKANNTSRIVSSAATTNATSAKASAGTVYVIEAMNTTATVKFLKLYNKASAPTVGTDTPVRTIALPPSNAPYNVHFPTGYYFSAGIAYALTGAAADADATVLAAGDVVGINIDYS